MAAEGAAQSGSGVAGMVCGVWVLVLVSSVLALEGERGRGPEKPHLPAETLHSWEIGKTEKRQKEGEGGGESFRERLLAASCALLVG